MSWLLYAPLVRDVHEGRGPLSGIEAALEHSRHDWNLFMPVDMPFLPTAFLALVDADGVGEREGGCADGDVDRGRTFRSRPSVCCIEMSLPYVKQAMEQGGFKLFRVFEEAERELSARRGVREVLFNLPWSEDQEFSVLPRQRTNPGGKLTKAQDAARRLWFANLNTPEEFAEAAGFCGCSGYVRLVRCVAGEIGDLHQNGDIARKRIRMEEPQEKVEQQNPAKKRQARVA